MQQGLLDDQLTQADQTQHMLVIVRVLVAVMLQEVIAWTAIGFVTLTLPLAIGPDTAPNLCLMLMIAGLVGLILTYCILLGASTQPMRDAALFGVLCNLTLVIVNSAILIHPTAATSFALILWLGALTVLLRLVHTPEACAPASEFAWLMGGACIIVAFVCGAQELTLAHVGANVLAMLLGALCSAFRWDWLAHHALASESTYSLKDVPIAWTDMYTWTCVTRAMNVVCVPPASAPVSARQQQ